MTLVHTLSHPGGEGPYPALFAFHGYGANEHDLIGIAPFIAEAKPLIVFPQALVEIEPGSKQFSWYHFLPPMPPRPEEVERTMEVVREFVDWAIERYHVDTERIALMGFSQGGSIAYRLGFEQPERFVGVAAIATSLPEEIGAEEPLTRQQKALPLLIQHGVDDPTVPVDRAREARQRLEDLDNRPEYREYKRMGHGVNADAAQNLSDWIERVLLKKKR